MKVLVTGGSGYLGIHVRRFFSADDFSRRSNLNILSENDAERVADYDAVIHLAAYLDKDPEAAALSRAMHCARFGPILPSSQQAKEI